MYIVYGLHVIQFISSHHSSIMIITTCILTIKAHIVYMYMHHVHVSIAAYKSKLVYTFSSLMVISVSCSLNAASSISLSLPTITLQTAVLLERFLVHITGELHMYKTNHQFTQLQALNF